MDLSSSSSASSSSYGVSITSVRLRADPHTAATSVDEQINSTISTKLGQYSEGTVYHMLQASPCLECVFQSDFPFSCTVSLPGSQPEPLTITLPTCSESTYVWLPPTDSTGALVEGCISKSLVDLQWVSVQAGGDSASAAGKRRGRVQVSDEVKKGVRGVEAEYSRCMQAWVVLNSGITVAVLIDNKLLPVAAVDHDQPPHTIHVAVGALTEVAVNCTWPADMSTLLSKANHTLSLFLLVTDLSGRPCDARVLICGSTLTPLPVTPTLHSYTHTLRLGLTAPGTCLLHTVLCITPPLSTPSSEHSSSGGRCRLMTTHRLGTL